MKKREKMILAFMLVALLYAAYSLFSGPSTPESKNTNVAAEKELANVKTLSTQLSEDLKKEALTDTERYILDRAEIEWGKDPFLQQKLSATPEGTKGPAGAKPGDFAYSGFVEVGKKRLAIINGMEYQVGEQLESGGYIVKSIEPEQVLLEDTGKRGQITLPFTAEIF
jgi:hypothetical protein